MPTQPFDPARAHRYGTFVQAAYDMFHDGDLAPAAPASFPAGYEVALVLTGIDHAAGRTVREFFGLVARPAGGAPGEHVVAVRGTDTTLEWMVDAEFRPVPFAALPAAGHVEQGFDAVFASLAAHEPNGAPADLHAYVRALPAGASLVVTGHSLGAAVATLLALDLAANAGAADVALYTFASPRPGSHAFAAAVNAHVPTCWRIVNAPDMVPKVPLLYAHVETEYVVDSNLHDMTHSLVTYHRMATYLALLDPGVAAADATLPGVRSREAGVR